MSTYIEISSEEAAVLWEVAGSDYPLEFKQKVLNTWRPLEREVLEFVRQKVRDGAIHGGCYLNEDRDCGCVLGWAAAFYLPESDDYTVGTSRWVSEALKPWGVVANVFGAAEYLVAAIEAGDTPETNPVSALVDRWLTELIVEKGGTV